MRILALDLSLTATGVASPTGELHTVKPDPRRGPERLCWIRDQLGDQVRAGVDLCVLEGYSYGSAYSHAHALGELGGVIRCLLHELHTGWVEVPKQAALGAQEAGPPGLIGGLLKGVALGVTRTVVGGLEAGTFFLPIPDRYEPILKPATVFQGR